MNTATILRVEDQHGARAVVTQADNTIWLADDLFREASQPDRERIPGDIEINGDTITFGTIGEGLGKLTYRLTGHDTLNGWHIAERQN